jgi:hypothetical protein
MGGGGGKGAIPPPTSQFRNNLKVAKFEIFYCSDFHDFYTIKSLHEGDFGVKKIVKNI